jgi:uncharacterized repeat protein (TIGR03803 family)
MTSLSSSRIWLWVAAATLSGCASISPTSQALPVGSSVTAPSATGLGCRLAQQSDVDPLRSALKIRYLHVFGGDGDGADPQAGLTYWKGAFYGTTYGGGAYGAGTVFQITPSGSYKVVHSFAGGTADGSGPYAGLVNVKGTLYGTTVSGGQYGDGTVFAILPSGKESVVHSFAGATDGAEPYADVIEVNDTIYGTTKEGGADGLGTVFQISPSGEESIVYSFKGGSDGQWPHAGLTDVSGTLYGTTARGGGTGCSGAGCGTVFKIAPSGGESIVHSFGGGNEGALPYGDLIDVNGTLYGTTLNSYSRFPGCPLGCGTVFQITPSGGFSVVGAPGKPYAGLIDVGGTLWGTTEFGNSQPRKHRGFGTIFEFTPSGGVGVEYAFPRCYQKNAHGAYPEARLIEMHDSLYGTTTTGTDDDRAGTVFSLRIR